MPPRIGITTSFEEGRQSLAVAYVRAVERAGGLPIILPLLESEVGTRELAASLDGLVIVGGPAIVDGLIGTLPGDIAETDPIRLDSDRLILLELLHSSRPILGICYGMQLINAELGGTIYADVEAQQADTLTHSQKRGAQDHGVVYAPDSYLDRLIGETAPTVNTRHIQAIAEAAPLVDVTCRSTDGVIEGFELDEGRVIGVQFHPELMGDATLPLFEHLVERARDHVAV